MQILASICIAQATVVSPPQQLRLEGGSEANNGKWIGGYWVFTLAIDQIDTMEGYITIPVNTTIEVDQYTKIQTNKAITLTFKPEKAYYKRNIKLADIDDRLVLPKYYGGKLGKILHDTHINYEASVDSFFSPHKVFAESGWQKYTTWTCKVLVDGNIQGSKTMNTEDGQRTLTVETNKGNILVKHLGTLEGQYTEPDIDSRLCIFDKNHIYNDALQFIRYDYGAYMTSDFSKESFALIEGSDAFSIYWVGNARWRESKLPAPYERSDMGFIQIVSPEKGWKAEDTLGFFIRNPIRPTMKDLIDYLNLNAENVASTWLNSYEDWTLEDNAIIVNLPYGAYSGTPLVTVYVPSELADTWVYHVPLSNAKIENVEWWTDNEIRTTKQCIVTLRQYANVTSSSIIKAFTNQEQAIIEPKEATVTLASNEVKQLTFTITNLGVESDTEGIITFAIERTFDGVETDRNSDLSFTLKAPPIDIPPDIYPIDEDDLEDLEVIGYVIPEEIYWYLIAGIILSITIIALRKKINRKNFRKHMLILGLIMLASGIIWLKFTPFRLGKEFGIPYVYTFYIGVEHLLMAIGLFFSVLGFLRFTFDEHNPIDKKLTDFRDKY